MSFCWFTVNLFWVDATLYLGGFMFLGVFYHICSFIHDLFMGIVQQSVRGIPFYKRMCLGFLCDNWSLTSASDWGVFSGRSSSRPLFRLNPSSYRVSALRLQSVLAPAHWGSTQRQRHSVAAQALHGFLLTSSAPRCTQLWLFVTAVKRFLCVVF